MSVKPLSNNFYHPSAPPPTHYLLNKTCLLEKQNIKKIIARASEWEREKHYKTKARASVHRWFSSVWALAVETTNNTFLFNCGEFDVFEWQAIDKFFLPLHFLWLSWIISEISQRKKAKCEQEVSGELLKIVFNFNIWPHRRSFHIWINIKLN